MTRTGILRLVNRFLNGSTATGDQYPGTSTNGYANQPNQYAGQLGARMEINYAAAQTWSDPALTTSSVQGCELQYVQFAADGTNYAVGQLLYWKDETKYIVTNVAPSSVSSNFAGFALGPVTQGYYWVMAVSGVAYALYRGSVTDTTVGDGVYAVVNTNTVDALADGTADATSGVNKLYIGTAKDAPANGGLKRIYIDRLVRVD